MQIFSLMFQRVNLFWKIAVVNVDCLSAYLCGGHKINLHLQFRSPFKHFRLLRSVEFTNLASPCNFQLQKRHNFQKADYGSSYRMCSVRKGVLRNFTTFTGKYLCQSLKPATLLKKRLWHRFFPVNVVKFLRTPFLQNTSGRLHLRLVSILIAKSFSLTKLLITNS